MRNAPLSHHSRNLVNPHHVLFLLFFIGVTHIGCSFVSTTYQNAVAYFNTYYNAKKAFDEAIAEIDKSRPATLRTNLFASTGVSQAIRTKLLAVIEKSSKIIQFYPKSSVADDALLLIGTSYYYLNEILPAEKKFIELLENFPRSDTKFEGKLMLAKTWYLADKSDEALRLTQQLVGEALDEDDEDIVLEALLLEGQIYLDRNDFTRAIVSYQRALEHQADGKLLALAAYLQAWCYEQQGEHRQASAGYVRVLDYDPEFVVEFHARLRAAMMFSLAGENDRSLELLEELSTEVLTPEQRSLVELECGNTYGRMERYQEALYQYLLVDSLYKRTDASAKSNFHSGVIFEHHLSDYAKAKAYYDKAKSEYVQSEVAPLAAKKSDMLGRYLLHRREFDRYDSLLSVVLNPPRADDTSGRSSREIDSTSIVRDSSLSIAGAIDSSLLAIVPLDTIHHRRSTNQLALGILFFVDLNQPDSSAYWLTRLLREYPESKLAPQALYVLSEVNRSRGNHHAADSLQRILLDKYPTSTYARNVTKSVDDAAVDSAEMYYGNVVRLLDRGNVQQAMQELRKLMRRFPGHAVQGKARYALGWIFENIIKNSDSAIVHYRRLVHDHPTSVYSERVRPKLAAIDENNSNIRSNSNDTTGSTGKQPPSKTGTVTPGNVGKKQEPEPVRKEDEEPNER